MSPLEDDNELMLLFVPLIPPLISVGAVSRRRNLKLFLFLKSLIGVVAKSNADFRTRLFVEEGLRGLLNNQDDVER